MDYKDYYQILEVDKKANDKEIKRAYRRLAQKYHPDKNPGNKAAEEKFKEINEAYEVVGNAENRARYDQLGRNYHRFQQMGGAPGGFDFSQWAAAGGPSGSTQRVNIDLSDLFGGSGGFSDFFNMIFGGGRRSASQTRQDQLRNQMSQKGQDIEQKVEISLEEAYHGTTRQIQRADGSTFSVKIPRGAKTGTKVRLSGKGKSGPGGSGNLLLVINVRKHDQFERKGENLRTSLPIDDVTAALGGKVTVPTLTGPVKLSVPAGTQGGQTIRLTGKGMPRLREKDQYGDLLVAVRIQVPENLSAQEKELYEKLAQLRTR